MLQCSFEGLPLNDKLNLIEVQCFVLQQSLCQSAVLLGTRLEDVASSLVRVLCGQGQGVKNIPQCTYRMRSEQDTEVPEGACKQNTTLGNCLQIQ